jgi:NADPH-dependent curcumin reductase CurA
MSLLTNVVTLARRPIGVPDETDFALQRIEMDAALGAGQVRCALRFLSLDPYLRGVIAGRHLGHAVEPGAVLPGSGLAQIIDPGSTDLASNTWVVGEFGWREQAIAEAQKLRVLPHEIFPVLAPYSTALGALGMPGLTAWAGITQLAKVQAGDTVLISAALGPVGSTAGQIAKALGARVIGIAGGARKCQLVIEQFQFDACIDYKATDFVEQLKLACPQRVNVYFDNVGGAVLAAALDHLALGARVVLCGLMDQYNQQQRPAGPNLAPVIGARAHLMGLVVYDYYTRWNDFFEHMLPLLQAKRLHWLEDISEGLAQAPAAFCRLMRGENLGKALVRL